MKIIPKALCFLCFLGLATTAALSLNGMLDSSISGVLVFTVALAVATALPGLIYRSLWPLTLVLLPAAAYLLIRVIMPLPDSVSGIAEQAHFYIDTLRLGGTAYTSETLPYPIAAHPGLRLVLALAVYVTTGAAALVALGLRRAIPAMLLLLALIGFGATADAAVRTIGSALVFLLFAICLLVFSRGLQREDWHLRDVLTGTGVGVVGAGLALALLLTVPSAAAEPWKDWRAWDPFRQGGSGYTFDWLQNYPDLLDPSKNRPVMTVQSSLPSYWKANSLDSFDGSSWTTGPAPQQRLDLLDNQGGYTFTVPASSDIPSGEKIQQIFDLHAVYTNFLFVGGDPELVVLPMNTDLRISEVGALVSTNALGPDFRYHVVAVVPKFEAGQLVDQGDTYPEHVLHYLALPFPNAAEIAESDPETAWERSLQTEDGDHAEWLGLHALSQKIVGEATDPYHKTLRIERYLRGTYRYTLKPRQDPSLSPYASFLFDTQEGYCQHFSGAMAVLLRHNGIPARVAVGFTTGDLRDGDYAVGTNNAHAWVEAYFPRTGWVAFDPTPGRHLPTEGGSSTGVGFVDPFGEQVTEGDRVAGSQTPPQQTPEGQALPSDAEGPRQTQSKTGVTVASIVAVLVLVLVAWPLGRAAWRTRAIRRGDLAQRLPAMVQLLRRRLAEYGVALGPASTTEEILNAAQHVAAVSPDPGLAARVDAVLFGGREAVRADLEALGSLRRQVGAALRHEHGWVRTLLAWYGVPRLG